MPRIASVQLDLLLCDWVFPFITYRGYMTELLFNVLITCLIFVFSLALLEMFAPLLPRPLPASVVDSRLSEKDNDAEDQDSEEEKVSCKKQLHSIVLCFSASLIQMQFQSYLLNIFLGDS
jgi:hypothetical protein